MCSSGANQSSSGFGAARAIQEFRSERGSQVRATGPGMHHPVSSPAMAGTEKGHASSEGKVLLGSWVGASGTFLILMAPWHLSCTFRSNTPLSSLSRFVQWSGHERVHDVGALAMSLYLIFCPTVPACQAYVVKAETKFGQTIKVVGSKEEPSRLLTVFFFAE